MSSLSLEALAPTQHELDELRTSMTRLAEALETERAREADLLSKVDAMPAALAQGREAVAAAQQAVTQLPALRQAREAAETAREAADRAVAISRELEELEPTLLEAREVRADARDALHVVRASRLAGMAAQLASGLEPHEPCPVCGSHEHPSPTAASPTDVSADDETEAEALVRGAEDAVGRLELQRERLRGRRSTADHAAGASTVEAAQEALDIATARCAETAATAEMLDERQAALTDLEGLHVAHQAALTEARASGPHPRCSAARAGEGRRAAESSARPRSWVTKARSPSTAPPSVADSSTPRPTQRHSVGTPKRCRPARLRWTASTSWSPARCSPPSARSVMRCAATPMSRPPRR